MTPQITSMTKKHPSSSFKAFSELALSGNRLGALPRALLIKPAGDRTEKGSLNFPKISLVNTSTQC
jgi:hypothetical protein